MEFVQEYVRQINSKHTQRAYRTDLRDFFGFWAQDERAASDAVRIKPSTIGRYIRGLQDKDLAVSTIERRISTIRGFFDWLIEQGHTSHNPARACRLNVDPKRDAGLEKDLREDAELSSSDVESLLQATRDGGYVGVRDRGLILTIVYGALRRSEVAAIDVEHVKPLGRHWVIDLPPVTSWSNTYVKIPDIVVEAIDEVREHYEITEGPLWRSVSNRNFGKRMTPDAIYKAIQSRGRQAGYENVNVETLRKTGLRLAVASGARLRDVQLHGRYKTMSPLERLQHSDGSTSRLQNRTMEFVGVSEGDVRTRSGDDESGPQK